VIALQGGDDTLGLRDGRSGRGRRRLTAQRSEHQRKEMKMFSANVDCQPRPKEIEFRARVVEFVTDQRQLKLLQQFIERKMVGD